MIIRRLHEAKVLWRFIILVDSREKENRILTLHILIGMVTVERYQSDTVVNDPLRLTIRRPTSVLKPANMLFRNDARTGSGSTVVTTTDPGLIRMEQEEPLDLVPSVGRRSKNFKRTRTTGTNTHSG